MKHLRLYEEFGIYTTIELMSYAKYLRDIYSSINDMADGSGVYLELTQFIEHGRIKELLHKNDNMSTKIEVINSIKKDILMFAKNEEVDVTILTFEDYTLGERRNSTIDKLSEIALYEGFLEDYSDKKKDSMRTYSLELDKKAVEELMPYLQELHDFYGLEHEPDVLDGEKTQLDSLMFTFTEPVLIDDNFIRTIQRLQLKMDELGIRVTTQVGVTYSFTYVSAKDLSRYLRQKQKKKAFNIMLFDNGRPKERT